MVPKNGRTRIVVRCARCESVYPAWEWPDGTIRIIGREACECGSTDLEKAEGATLLSNGSEKG